VGFVSCGSTNQIGLLFIYFFEASKSHTFRRVRACTHTHTRTSHTRTHTPHIFTTHTTRIHHSRTHTHTHTHTVWLLWTIGQLIAEAATYTTNTGFELNWGFESCFQRDSNSQSQVSSGHRPHSHRCAVFLSTRPVQPIARGQHFARKTELCCARSHSKWEIVFLPVHWLCGDRTPKQIHQFL
jgi:hypothetical protein